MLEKPIRGLQLVLEARACVSSSRRRVNVEAPRQGAPHEQEQPCHPQQQRSRHRPLRRPGPAGEDVSTRHEQPDRHHPRTVAMSCSVRVRRRRRRICCARRMTSRSDMIRGIVAQTASLPQCRTRVQDRVPISNRDGDKANREQRRRRGRERRKGTSARSARHRYGNMPDTAPDEDQEDSCHRRCVARRILLALVAALAFGSARGPSGRMLSTSRSTIWAGRTWAITAARFSTHARPAGHVGRAARAVLRAALLFPDAGRGDDRTLPHALRFPDPADSVVQPVRPARQRASVARSFEGGRLPHSADRQGWQLGHAKKSSGHATQVRSLLRSSDRRGSTTSRRPTMAVTRIGGATTSRRRSPAMSPRCWAGRQSM